MGWVGGFRSTAKVQLRRQDSLGEQEDKRTRKGIKYRQGSDGMLYDYQGM